MSSTLFYIGFTPSCNKDADKVLLLGWYDTAAEAEARLQQLLRHRLVITPTLLADAAVDPKGVWESLPRGASEEDEPAILSRRAFVFPRLAPDEYGVLLGADFFHLGCTSYPAAFWILETPADTMPGLLRQEMMSWLL